MDYGTEVKEVAPQPVAVVRERVARDALGDFFERSLDDVLRYLETAGADVSGPAFGRFHEYGEAEVDVEAGYPVLEVVEGSGTIGASELPGGRVVATVHEGSYDGLGAAHDAAVAYCAEGGYEVAGAPWEVYWTGPRDGADPDGWRTEVVYPIK